jgi:hypothetical protein
MYNALFHRPLRKAAKRAENIIESHRAFIERRATRIIRSGGSRLERVRKRADLGRRIRSGARNTVDAGEKFGRWLRRRFPPDRIRKSVRRMSLGCGIGGVTMFALKKKNGKSNKKAFNAAIDGCIGGAAATLVG